LAEDLDKSSFLRADRREPEEGGEPKKGGTAEPGVASELDETSNQSRFVKSEKIIEFSEPFELHSGTHEILHLR
jgi:hypothetical protein